MLLADDTTLVTAGRNLPNLLSDLESDLKFVYEWLDQNRLLLNVSKSNPMIFKWRYQLKSDRLNTNLDAHTNSEIKYNGLNLPFAKKLTQLGVTLDEYLIFETHTISLCPKVNWKVSSEEIVLSF